MGNFPECSSGSGVEIIHIFHLNTQVLPLELLNMPHIHTSHQCIFVVVVGCVYVFYLHSSSHVILLLFHRTMKHILWLWETHQLLQLMVNLGKDLGVISCYKTVFYPYDLFGLVWSRWTWLGQLWNRRWRLCYPEEYQGLFTVCSHTEKQAALSYLGGK